MRIRPFSPSGPSGRDVVKRFLNKDAKNIPDAEERVYSALRFLELTPAVDCKSQGYMTAVRDGVEEFKWNMRDHWLRILLAYWPTGDDVAILHLLAKKTNKLPPEDAAQAVKNFSLLKQQIRGRR